MRFLAVLTLLSALLLGAAVPAAAQGCGPSNPNCIVPTAPPGTDNNQAASTAFVQQALSGSINLPENEILVGNTAGIATAVPMSGDCTVLHTGAVTCLKTNGVAFGALATLTPGSGVATALANAANGNAGMALNDSAPVNGNCVQYDSSGGLVPAGTACTTGSVSAGLAGEVAYYNADGSTVVGSTVLGIFTGNVGIGTTSPVSLLNVQQDITIASDIAQFIVSGATNPAKRLLLGFDTSLEVGFIQPTISGTSFNTLDLVPHGGGVVIGTSAASPSGANLAIYNGDTWLYSFEGWADIRQFNVAVGPCNPSVPVATNVAAAAWAASQAGYDKVFIPKGCVWDMSQNGTVSSGSWTNNTLPNNLTISCEDFLTLCVTSGPVATFTGTVSSCTGSNGSYSCTLTTSAATGTIATGTQFYGGTSSSAVTGTISTGSGTSWGVTGVTFHLAATSIGPIAMGSSPSLAIGTNSHMDNAAFFSGDCASIDTLDGGAGVSTSGWPTQCSVRHFNASGNFIGSVTGYPFTYLVSQCAPSASVPGVTGTWNDMPCMAFNVESSGDVLFVNDIGASAGGANPLGNILNFYNTALFSGPMAQWQNNGNLTMYSAAGTSMFAVTPYGAGFVLAMGNASSSHDSGSFSIQDTFGKCTFFTNSSGGAGQVCSSDVRLKHDFEDSGDALAWLSSFKIKDYTANADAARHTGIIAQDLLITHPEMVHLDKTDTRCDGGCYGVSTPNEWKMIRAMQQMQAEIDSLKRRLN